MKKLSIWLAASLILFMSIMPACESMRQDMILTKPENIKPGYTQVVKIDEALASKIADKMNLSDEQEKALLGLVLTDLNALKDPNSEYIPLGVESFNWKSMLFGVYDIASTFFPQLAAFGGILGLLFKRPRKHLASAAKSILPLNGSVDVGEAVMSLGRAVGLAHSSPASKVAHEEVA